MKLQKVKLYSTLLIILSIAAFTNSCQKDDDKETVLTEKNIVFNDSCTYETITDIEGNVYKTIKIGSQIWMAENLKTSKYNDGSSIPLITNQAAWDRIQVAGYCYYNWDTNSNKNNYGALYNWYAVNTGKLAPKGWHIPSDSEWTTLANYLGGVSVAGSKLKEIDTVHWKTTDVNNLNESGFTGLPGGKSDANGYFFHQRKYGYWWSSTEFSDSKAAFYFGLSDYSTSADIGTGYHKSAGFSVRCIKD